MKKLNNQEINKLFDFTKKHYVELYDVQIELVDHLANAIEKEWEINPKLSFEDALQIEFKKFGVFGFTGLIEQKQTALHSFYNKMLWNEVLKFISVPKIVLTVIMYFSIFFFLKETEDLGEIIVSALLLLSFIYYLIDGFSFMIKIKREQKKEGKNWLLQSVAVQVLTLPFLQFTAFGFPLFSKLFFENIGLSVFGMHLFTFFVLLQMIALYVFLKVIKPQILLSIEQVKNKFQIIS